MRIRFTAAIGTPVLEEDGAEPVGTLSGILVHPDTGVVEGVFVTLPGFFGGSTTFLLSIDILHWGLRILIRDRSVFCDPREIVRLQSIVDDGRTVLGQPIRTESGKTMGRCADIQLSSKAYRLEWIFPRKFFRWGRPIRATQIVEVTPEAIVVKDAVAPVTVEEQETEVPVIPQVEAA